MPAPVVTYAQINDPSVSLPGLPGVMDPVMRTIQAFAIYALNSPPPAAPFARDFIPAVDVILASLLRVFASTALGL